MIAVTGLSRPVTVPAADYYEPLTRRPPMVVRKRSTKAPRNPYLTAATPDELGPANRIAYDIVAERRDLLPSVERIMNAGARRGWHRRRPHAVPLFADRCRRSEPRPASGDRRLFAGVGERGGDSCWHA